MDSTDFGFDNLLQKFPALYQISIWQGGKVIFRRTNQGTRENVASILFRELAATWAGIFSCPPETFQHRIATRSNIRSAAKSIVALLVGIALRDGLITSLDQTLGSLLPNESTSTIGSTKQGISLRHLLTMTSGLASLDSGVKAFRLFSSHNWTRFMLDLPLASRPGETFIYNSANPHLISAILSRLSGESLLAYANRNLFEPLGIQNVIWGAGPEGITFGGGNLFLSADELLCIGELCLRRGAWNGKQIIPATWFDEMWHPHQEYFPGWNYGYYWYLHDEINSKNGHTYITYSAAGTGGQKLLIIPKLELILAAVATTDFLGERGIALNQFIRNQLIKAIEDGGPAIL